MGNANRLLQTSEKKCVKLSAEKLAFANTKKPRKHEGFRGRIHTIYTRDEYVITKRACQVYAWAQDTASAAILVIFCQLPSS